MRAASGSMSHLYNRFVLLRIAKGDCFCDEVLVARWLEHKGLGVDGHCVIEMLMVVLFFFCNLDKVTTERMNGGLTEEFMALECNRSMAHKQV